MITNQLKIKHFLTNYYQLFTKMNHFHFLITNWHKIICFWKISLNFLQCNYDKKVAVFYRLLSTCRSKAFHHSSIQTCIVSLLAVSWIENFWLLLVLIFWKKKMRTAALENDSPINCQKCFGKYQVAAHK